MEVIAVNTKMKRVSILLLAMMLTISVVQNVLAEGTKKVTVMINQTWNKPSMGKLP